jgi:hypothetical protein
VHHSMRAVSRSHKGTYLSIEGSPARTITYGSHELTYCPRVNLLSVSELVVYE